MMLKVSQMAEKWYPLKGSALDLVSNISMTDNNYGIAVKMLQSRCGQPPKKD